MTTEVLLTPTNAQNGHPPTLNGNNRSTPAKAQNVHGPAEGSSRGSLPVGDDDGCDSVFGRSPQRLVMIGADQQRVSYHCGGGGGGGSLGRQSLAGSDRGSPRQMRSPRCEAFVMTGEKMLSLNPKISPCYAKMCQNQLPPMVEVDSQDDQLLSTTPKGVFDDFPSVHRISARRRLQEVPAGVVPGSQSENLLNAVAEQNGAEESEAGGQHLLNGESSGGHGDQQSTSGTTEATVEVENTVVDMDKTIERFMASQQSQSTPVTPARGLSQQQQQMAPSEAEASGSGSNNINKQHQGRAGGGTRIGSSISNRSSDVLMLTSTSSMTHQSVYTPETISRLARHLFTHQEGIRIAAFLVKSDDLSLRIAREFVAMFNFAGLRVDAALRAFLGHVCLTGETSERAQLLGHFAQRYHECNPTVFNSADEVQALTCALLLLNKDIHGKAHCSSGKKMSCREFIDNLSHTEYKYDHALLKELYAAVKEQPFHYQMGSEAEQQSDQQQQSTSANGKKREKRLSRMLSSSAKRGAIGLQRSSTAGLVDPEQQVDYKHGWLLKKSLYDADGKRTPLGRRKWQMHYATIRGMVLYLHLNEHSFSSAGHRYITFRNCILLHHAMAEPSRDYAKRRNVFHVRTAQLGELLFQTSEPEEVQRWCDAVNYVAAVFSTPALPAPVGPNGVVAFYKPHLPSTPTHLSIPDQLRAHEQRLEETMANLARLREQAPPLKARGKVVHEYYYKERYLETEKDRYSAYISILREKLTRASSAALHYGDSLSSNTLLMTGTSQNNGKKAIFALSNGPISNFEESNRRDCSGSIVTGSQVVTD